MTKPKPVDKFLRDDDRNPTGILSRLKSKKQLRKFGKKHAKTWRQDFYDLSFEGDAVSIPQDVNDRFDTAHV